MNLVWGTITLVDEDYCQVTVDGREGENGAVAYRNLVGTIEVGDRVLLNTTAVDLGLGTGGDHFVVARIAKDAQPEGVAYSSESGGHLMKLRYSPMQRDVLAVESPEASTHKIMEKVTSLEDIPVVCCGLHSQMPIVAATVKAIAPHLRVGYVMTDQAALHMDYSCVVKECVQQGLIDTTVSTGQALGGEYEAINLYSGLLAACHVGACDVVIVAIGPGVAGTGTPFGHGGIAQGEAINAVASLGGRPIAVLRMSFADERERHQGISHHTMTALESVALAPAIIPVPLTSDPEQTIQIEDQLNGLTGAVEHHGIFFEEPIFDSEHLGGMKVTTMGRGYDEDPIFFEAAAAAGAVAAQIGSTVADDAINAFRETMKDSGTIFGDESDESCAPSACASCKIACPSAGDSSEKPAYESDTGSDD